MTSTFNGRISHPNQSIHDFHVLEVSRRNAGIDEKKDSPSKTAKIVMRYISSLTDVGMQRSNQ
jgi:hypothetical protein